MKKEADSDLITGIIILNYNNAADTIECVESVLQSNVSGFKICVVDNASTDDSWQVLNDWLNEKKPRPVPKSSPLVNLQNSDISNYLLRKKEVSIIKAEKNLGYAAGNNIGIKYLENKYLPSYFWILNNDTVVTNDSLSTLLSKINGQGGNQALLINQMLMHYAEPNKVQALGGKLIRPWLSSEHIGENLLMDKISEIKTDDIQYPVGASLFFNRDYFEKAGFMDEGYFLYYEEIDWVLRAMDKGASLINCFSPIVFHKHGASTKKVSEVGIAYSVRNRLRFAARNDSLSVPFVIIFILIFCLKKVLKREWDVLKVLISPPHKSTN